MMSLLDSKATAAMDELAWWHSRNSSSKIVPFIFQAGRYLCCWLAVLVIIENAHKNMTRTELKNAAESQTQPKWVNAKIRLFKGLTSIKISTQRPAILNPGSSNNAQLETRSLQRAQNIGEHFAMIQHSGPTPNCYNHQP